MLKAPLDYIIVKLDKAFQDEIITPSGVTLYKDTYFNPEWNVSVTGRVVSVPNRLSSRLELKGLEIEPKEGDEIIVSYMVVFDMDIRDKDTPVHHNLFYHEGEYYWKVDYIFFLGRIQEGKIIPAQDYVFLEPIAEEKQEKVGLIWMPDMVKKEKPKGRARVVAVGRPKEGEPALSVREGDIVKFNERLACRYEIKGKEYILLRHHQILAAQIA